MKVIKEFYEAPQLELTTLAARRCIAMSLGGTTEEVGGSSFTEPYTTEDGSWGN